jgi:hypothetical protein
MQAQFTRASIGAGATVPNVLTGTALEYFTGANVLTIYGNGDITGMSFSLTFNMGGKSEVPLPPGNSLGVASTAGKIKTNEDFLIQTPVPAGARLVLSVTNPGAASFANFQLVTG